MGRNRLLVLILLGLAYPSCQRKIGNLVPASYLIYSDSSTILKYTLQTGESDTLFSFKKSYPGELKKVNDSIISISVPVPGNGTYCIKDLITLKITNHYTHEAFFDLLDSYADDSLFFIVDTTHYYNVNIFNRKVSRYRTDILTWVLSQVPIAGWTGLPIHPNVPEEGYHMTNYFYNSQNDTFTFRSYTRNDPSYPAMEDYLMESEVHNHRMVFSSKGNLYLKTYWRTDTLIKNPRRQWRYWTGDGAYDPSLSHDGSKVVFRCLNGQHRVFADGRVAIGDSGIYELNLNTREMNLVIDRHYENPEYSPDDQFLLLYDHNAYLHNFTFLIYNLNTKELKTIAEGNNCIWF